MSKSSRTPHPHSHAGKSGKRATAPADGADARPRAPGHPWVIGGIDYGPAAAAIHDLTAWAFDLAARDVTDWPEGQRRVRTARRFVLARLRGKHPGGAPIEDVLFTAGLLARIFEAELRLPLTDMLAIFDRLGLPTEEVPLRPRAPSATCRPQTSPVTPIMPIRPCPGAAAARPASIDACEGCGHAPRFRAAA